MYAETNTSSFSAELSMLKTQFVNTNNRLKKTQKLKLLICNHRTVEKSIDKNLCRVKSEATS